MYSVVSDIVINNSQLKARTDSAVAQPYKNNSKFFATWKYEILLQIEPIKITGAILTIH